MNYQSDQQDLDENKGDISHHVYEYVMSIAEDTEVKEPKKTKKKKGKVKKEKESEEELPVEAEEKEVELKEDENLDSVEGEDLDKD